MQEKKLRELLVSLTLEEKVFQMVQLSGSYFDGDDTVIGSKERLEISKRASVLAGSVLNVLGAERVKRIQDNYLKKSKSKIPLLFMADIIYGYRTVYPIPLALGCTWDPDLVREAFRETAREAYPSGAQITFAPMADLVRDPRWGRCMESTGEDGFLNSCYVRAMVQGLQNAEGDEACLPACVKHFAAYGAAEGGRDYNTVDMSERRMRQDYLGAYRAAVEEGCRMVMTSFNLVDGIPATANEWLQREVLRKEWGFDGVLISDYGAVGELIEHGVAGDEEEAAELAVKASIDIDMQSPCYANYLVELVASGRLSESCVDEAVWRILKLKNDMGLFENPYFGADEAEEEKMEKQTEKRTLARKTAGESIVLLKNDKAVLPVCKSKKIALIGPYGDCKNILGFWAVYGRAEDSVSLREALEEYYGSEQIRYAKGCEILEDGAFLEQFGTEEEKKSWHDSTKKSRKKAIDEALLAGLQSDMILLALGEHAKQSGEAGSKTRLRLPANQMKLLRELKKLGKPIVLILFNGRPLVLEEPEAEVDGIVEAWFPGTEGGHALCDIISGEVNPSARLSMSFPQNEGQIPVYYNALRTGRPGKDKKSTNRFLSGYLDCDNEPRYTFGYGLSYHECVYEKLSLSRKNLTGSGSIVAKATIFNSSETDGEEIVQLYIQDVSASIARSVKELKAFRRIKIKAGERIEVSFEIEESMLRFYNKEMQYVSESGAFKVFVGKNAREVLETEFYFTAEK